MLIESDKILAYMGELYGAALHDLESADPSDVGLNGVSIVEWRKAYLEGIKDTVAGVVTRVPDDQREGAQQIVTLACAAARANLKAETSTETPL